MRYFNYLGFLIAVFFNQWACSQTLSEKIDELIAQQLPSATVGILIKDVETGNIIYSRNANKLMTPASSTKLFTAAAALYYLKPDFRFLTTLYQKNQDIYLKFTGSPSLTDRNLTDLLSHLKKNNINTIEGNVVIDTTRYPPPYYLRGDSYDDLGWAYTAPDTAAMLNENAETYELVSAKTLGLPIEIKAKSKSKALTFINEVTTVNRADEKNHCSLNLEILDNNTLRLFGCLAQTKEPKTVEFAIPDPILFAQQVIKKSLDTEGIHLKGKIIKGATPPDAKEIARFQSAKLAKLITHMLQKSDNLYANSMTRALGDLVVGRASHQEGVFAIRKIITEHAQLDMKQMDLVDGEGTRYNLISAEQFVSLLDKLYQNKYIQPILLNALPQAGISGTLQLRMKDTILERKVFAKTGSMHDVSSLTGFIINPNSKSFVFSIIINGVVSSNARAKALEEKILLTVDEYFLENDHVYA